jgi:hypothetical protein
MVVAMVVLVGMLRVTLTLADRGHRNRVPIENNVSPRQAGCTPAEPQT